MIQEHKNSKMSEYAASDSEQSGDVDTDPKLKCSWCLKGCKQLVEGRKYCLKCKSSMYKECRTCKRPLDSPSYFKLENDRCNSCSKKLERSRSQRARRPTSKREGVGNSIVPEPVAIKSIPPAEWYAIMPIVSFKSLKQNSESHE